jgi:hypothetical protein
LKEKAFLTHLYIHSIPREILSEIFNILSIHSKDLLLHLPMANQRKSTLKFTLLKIQYSLFVTIQQLDIVVMKFANLFPDHFVRQPKV